jgi:hypothetical protein
VSEGKLFFLKDERGIGRVGERESLRERERENMKIQNKKKVDEGEG